MIENNETAQNMLVFPDIKHANIDSDVRKKINKLYGYFGADLDGDCMTLAIAIIILARQIDKKGDSND